MRVVTVMAALGVAATAATSRGQVDPVDLPRLLAAAVPGWDAIRAAGDKLPSLRLTARTASDDTVVFGSRLPAGKLVRELAYTDGHFLSASEPDIPYAKVIGLNPHYYFELSPSAQTPKRWVIARVERVLHEQDLVARRAALMANETNPLITVNHVPLAALVADKRFAPVSVGTEQGLYKVAYKYDLSAGFVYPNVLPIESGTVWLDPDHHFAVSRSVTVTRSRSTTVQHEFVHALGRLPTGESYLRGMTHRVDDKPVADVTYTADLRGPPEAEYYLTRFGLPEPDWYVRRRASERYVWVACGVGAVLLAGLAWRLKRRGR